MTKQIEKMLTAGKKRRAGRPSTAINAKQAAPALTKKGRRELRMQKRAAGATAATRKAEKQNDVEMNDASESEAEEEVEMELEDGSDDEMYYPGSDRKLSIEERKELGMVFATQEEVRVAIKVAYVLEYNEPDESEWGSIATNLNARWGIRRRTVKEVFQRLRDGNANATKQKTGAGRPRKLKSDNEGLIAAAAALNNGTPPSLAVYICNSVNKRTYPSEYEDNLKICRNTLMATLKASTDFQANKIPRRKQRIIDAEGVYIEDSSKKIVRSGVRGEAEARIKRESLPVDPVALNGFNRMLKTMRDGEGVRFEIDLTGDDDVLEEEEPATLLQTVSVDEGDEDDNDGGEEDEEG